MRYRAITTLGLCVLASANTSCMTAIAAFQPEIGTTIVLTTVGADGTTHERVLSPIDDDGQLFVAANHWPRAWYHRALANPNVRVTRDGHTADYRAVPVSEEERERLLHESGFPLVAYIFTGFAPRQFLRLDLR
jgi:deazaflavin-dependent oxidoreductase (nitroreductase family)